VEFIEIKQTNIRPSRIGLGTWAIGGWMWGGPDDEAAIATIHRALEGRRDAAVIATKAEIERILTEEVPDPIGPEFMAPPLHATV
jgi:aryl-alcohol dehydrogenase-like predicted oxidoreductase